MEAINPLNHYYNLFCLGRLSENISKVRCNFFFLGANLCPLAVFPKKTNSIKYSFTNCQKFGKTNILENSHIVQASNQGINFF